MAQGGQLTGLNVAPGRAAVFSEESREDWPAPAVVPAESAPERSATSEPEPNMACAAPLDEAPAELPTEPTLQPESPDLACPPFALAPMAKKPDGPAEQALREAPLRSRPWTT
jgi:hypothetical protein